MRGVLIVGVVMVGLGTVMAHLADRMTSPAAMAHPALSRASTDPQDDHAGLRRVSIRRDDRGHFRTEGRIDGRRIGFMVDTGASVVAMNESSAARIGIHPSRADFSVPVSTANGVIQAARTRLPVIEVGGLVVRDVDAMVLPDAALSENLLGLSFLSRLKRFEYADGTLVLVSRNRSSPDDAALSGTNFGFEGH